MSKLGFIIGTFLKKFYQNWKEDKYLLLQLLFSLIENNLLKISFDKFLL